jgi:D-3-phosphoglycerate dehydrogenase
MDMFRIALSGDFRRPTGEPVYPSFDLRPLTEDPRIELAWVDAVNGSMPGAALAGVDALILLGHRLTADAVASNERLQVVARFGVGYDSVDVPALAAKAIPLVITPDGVRRPVAVSIITYVLALSQRLLIKDRLVREGPAGWAKRSAHMGSGLIGRTLGQLGLGNIGAEVFRLAAPFGMHHIAHDPFADAAVARDLGVELVPLDELFRRADYLSVSVPLSEATHHIVNAERLALMRPTAYLINTARGPVVDQRALHRALVEGTIAGAGLDVFEVEPCPADEPILALDNVILSPHSLCWTDECFAGIGRAAVKGVIDVMEGRVPTGIVDRRVAAEPRFLARLEENRRRFA